MRTNAILRAAVLSVAALCLSLGMVDRVLAQDVSVDVGAGAGIFRAKNPETKKGGDQSDSWNQAWKPSGRNSASPGKRCGASGRLAR